MTDHENPVTLLRIDGRIDGPWSVGAAAATPGVNLPVLVDPRTNMPVLPATTLIGSLRAHLTVAISAEFAANWCGPDTAMADAGNGSSRQPSRLWAFGVQLNLSRSDVGLLTRTSIDPRRRAARGGSSGGSLRTEQLVEPPMSGSTLFRWVLEHEGTPDDQLLSAIAGWNAQIGGRQTMGLGALSVTAVRAWGFNLSEPESLTWWLSKRSRWLTLPLEAETPAELTPPVTAVLPSGVLGAPAKADDLRFEWRIVEPLHIGDSGTSDIGGPPKGDRQSLTKLVRRERPRADGTGSSKAVMPGSSWKGLFRHRVEHILRATGANDVQRGEVIAVLFGAAGSDRTSRPGRMANSNESPGRRGLLGFANSVVSNHDGVSPAFRKRTHVAIDRIGGGAAEGRLFVFEGVESGALALTISNATAWEPAVTNLLNHVVWDLHQGIIGIGGATNRGYGSIALRNQELPDTDPVDLTALAAWAHDILRPASQERQ